MKASQAHNQELVEIGRQKKAAKGTIKIKVDKGWLRLRFTYQGKRYSIALGLTDSRLNKEIAADKARKIELDILSGNFDETLAKYKPWPIHAPSKLNLVTTGG